MMSDLAPHGITMKLLGVEGANPGNFKKHLKKGHNITWVPGGFEEATKTSTKDYNLVIQGRKGFIKYALQHGYKIHPTFVFNENKCYYTFSLKKLGLMLNKLKMPGIIFTSQFGLIPNYNVDITMVIGKEI